MSVFSMIAGAATLKKVEKTFRRTIDKVETYRRQHLSIFPQGHRMMPPLIERKHLEVKRSAEESLRQRCPQEESVSSEMRRARGDQRPGRPSKTRTVVEGTRNGSGLLLHRQPRRVGATMKTGSMETWTRGSARWRKKATSSMITIKCWKKS
jgi:hypothetical protein